MIITKKRNNTNMKTGEPLEHLLPNKSFLFYSLSRKSFTHFEGLSNELIYEVFEYLHDFHVYQAFYNLNIRFYNLITYSTFPLQINILPMSKSNYQQYYKDIIEINTHRINSFCLSNLFIYDIVSSPIRILSELLQLENLVLDNIESKSLEKLLPKLISLPSLSSLTINSADTVKNGNDIYSQVVRLPALKYCKLSLEGWSRIDLSILSTANNFSPIEYLNINNSLCMSQLDIILSYVPRIRHLTIQTLRDYWIKLKKQCSLVFSHLTHVSLKLGHISFDRFQRLIVDCFPRIQVLRVSIECNADVAYASSKKWEQLILCHMPNLRVFDIRHEDWPINITNNTNNSNNCLQTLDNGIDQFESLFWIERQWFFALQYYQSTYKNRTIFYSTDPYRYQRMNSFSLLCIYGFYFSEGKLTHSLVRRMKKLV